MIPGISLPPHCQPGWIHMQAPLRADKEVMPLMDAESNDGVLVAVAWAEGGDSLMGLMAIRRSDGCGAYVPLTFDLRRALATLDREVVQRLAGQLLQYVVESLSDLKYAPDKLISDRFLRAGPPRAVAGTMRHIPPSLRLHDGQTRDWKSGLFLVEVGELTMEHLGGVTIH
jgi:hypothetical protein